MQRAPTRHWLVGVAFATLATAAGAGTPDGGTVNGSFTVCDASACGDDFLAKRGVTDLSPTVGMKPQAAVPPGTVPERIAKGATIRIKVGQSKLIRLPCRVLRLAAGNTPWDFSSTPVPEEGVLKGMFEGHAAMRIWCTDNKALTFDVYVDR